MNETMMKLLKDAPALYPYELEKRFPRILNKVVELWDSPQLEAYFNELLIDTRNGHTTRQGFPVPVATEIFRLSQARERLRQQPGGVEEDPWAHINIDKQHEIERLGFKCTPHGFHQSAEANNRNAVALFLSAGIPVDTKDERGWTPLMISSFNGNEQIAELLIRSGAKVQATDNAGYGPIHWAAYNGYANVVKLLIVKHADVNARSRHGWTPMLQAAARGHLAAASALIAAGADVNLASNDGWTPLHKACANGHIDVVKLLLAARADRNAQYQTGVTPLALAIKNKREDIVRLLGGKSKDQS